MEKSYEELFGSKLEFVKRGDVEVDSETFNMPSVATTPLEKPDTKLSSQLLSMDDDLLGGSDNLLGRGTTNDNSKKTENMKAMEVDLLDMDFANDNANANLENLGLSKAQPNSSNNNNFDIIGEIGVLNPTINQAKTNDNNTNTNDKDEDEENLFGDDDGADFVDANTKMELIQIPEETLVKKSVGGKAGKSGLVVKGNIWRDPKTLELQLFLKIKNTTNDAVSNLTLQLKPNYFGLKVAKPTQTSIGNLFR